MNTVVVGAGLAGASAVEELRELGYEGDVTLVGAELHPPYERPPLSKGLLLGTDDIGTVFVHDPQWYADHGVDLRLGQPATSLDLGDRRVHLADGSIPYDQLLLTTGSTARRLPGLEAGAVPVVTLRRLEDSLWMRDHLDGHVLIVGAGWIGLEVAAAARTRGARVSVVETARLPLLGVLGPELAQVVADLHRDHGVDLRLGTALAEVDGGTVVLSDSTRVQPDLVLVAIGADPDDGLASAAGLVTGNGVHTDARLRTSNPHVHAAGDVANHDHPDLGRLRVEHWDNAIAQGRHAARSMLGDPAPYDRLPSFFTDQYDLGMEYVGHVAAGDRPEIVVRGDLEKRVVTAFFVTDGRVAAGLHLNDWDATEHLRRIVGQPLDPRLRDPEVDLDDIGRETQTPS